MNGNARVIVEFAVCMLMAYFQMICRVVEGFEAFDFGLTWEDYVEVNRESCKRLRKAHE